MSMQTYPMYDIGIVLVELLPYLNKAAMEMYPEQYGLSPEEEKNPANVRCRFHRCC